MTRANRAAVATAAARPASVPPVRVILAMSGWCVSASPTSRPPVTTFTTPSGTPASRRISTRARVDSGVVSDGLTTTVLPVASAADRLRARISSGWLNGVMIPQTPSGVRRW